MIGTDEKNVKRWLNLLARHYGSLIVSGVCHNALAHIERLEAELEIERHKTAIWQREPCPICKGTSEEKNHGRS